jgi:hypothetical protein
MEKHCTEIMKLCNVSVIEISKNVYPEVEEELAA